VFEVGLFSTGKRGSLIHFSAADFISPVNRSTTMKHGIGHM